MPDNEKKRPFFAAILYWDKEKANIDLRDENNHAVPFRLDAVTALKMARHWRAIENLMNERDQKAAAENSSGNISSF